MAILRTFSINQEAERKLEEISKTTKSGYSAIIRKAINLYYLSILQKEKERKD